MFAPGSEKHLVSNGFLIPERNETRFFVREDRRVTCGKLGEVTAGSLAQAAHMELTLALVTQDHGAVTEGTQGKVGAAADVAPSCIVV